MPPKYFRKCKTALGNRTHFLYNPHMRASLRDPSEEDCIEKGNVSENYRQFVAIDPGVTNTGVYVEIIWNNGVEQYEGHELIHPLPEKSNVYPEIIEAGSRVIDELLPLLKKTHYIIIESQVDTNPTTTALGRHYISCCFEKLKDKGFRPRIIEINPDLKTKLLGAPPEIKTKYQRKKWCAEKALQILDERGESKIAESIFGRRKKGEGKNKKDDIGDGICMVRAFKKILSETDEWKEFQEK